jgi:hypothetical protein
MNKRISIKGTKPLMAIFALPLLVSLSISLINPMASFRVSASGYDLPIGDHEGFPVGGASETVASDYNPLRAKVRTSKNAANAVDHGYYYAKLNTIEKRDLYDAIYIACDSARRLKKSDSLPESGSEADVVNKGGYLFYSGSESRLRYYDAETFECSTVVNEAIEALCYDHMANVEYYMCDWQIYEFKTGNVYKDYIIMQEYTADDYDKIDQAVAAKAKEYANKVKALGLVDANNTAVTVLNVHDWYTKQVVYGNIGSTGKSYFNFSHTAYGALCKGRAVCDGYSLGYALILKELGINTKVVTGYAKTSSGSTGGHAWNMVNIGGDWYEEDTTWADASNSSGAYINHAYYNKTTYEYRVGIEGSKHERGAPYGGRLIDSATGTKYTYEATLALLSGQEPQYNDNSGEESSTNTDSTNENSSDNNTTTTDTSYNELVTLEASPIVCKVNSDQTATIRGVTDTADSTLDIPSTVEINGKEYPVTEIEAEAFKGNRNIREITGGHNIVSIGKAAFSNCKNLRTVDLSQADVKTIGAKAFNGCGKLKKVKLNGDYLKKVGSKAFNKLNKEVKITIYARNKKTYNKLVTKVTKAGAKNAKFKSKKSLGIKYN